MGERGNGGEGGVSTLSPDFLQSCSVRTDAGKGQRHEGRSLRVSGFPSLHVRSIEHTQCTIYRSFWVSSILPIQWKNSCQKSWSYAIDFAGFQEIPRLRCASLGMTLPQKDCLRPHQEALRRFRMPYAVPHCNSRDSSTEFPFRSFSAPRTPNPQRLVAFHVCESGFSECTCPEREGRRQNAGGGLPMLNGGPGPEPCEGHPARPSADRGRSPVKATCPRSTHSSKLCPNAPR